jgi:hypothetical protein
MSRLLDLKIDLIIFLYIFIMYGNSLSVGVCGPWNMTMMSVTIGWFSLCITHIVIGVTRPL